MNKSIKNKLNALARLCFFILLNNTIVICKEQDIIHVDTRIKAAENISFDSQVEPKTIDIIFRAKCNYLPGDLCEELQGKPVKEWQKNIVEILAKKIKATNNSYDYFLSKLWRNGCYTDTTWILFLISLLDYPIHEITCEPIIDTTNFTTRMERIMARRLIYESMEGCPPNSRIFVRYALECLIHIVDVSIIKKYSALIQKKLQNGRWRKVDNKDRLFSLNNKYRLLSLTDISNEDKNKILIEKRIYNWIRARMGDKKMEVKLIDQYRSEENYKEKQKLAMELSLIGTPECLKTLLYSFSTPIYKQPGSGFICKYFRREIVAALARHHAGDSDFTKQHQGLRDVSLCNNGKVKMQINKFINWAEKQYNISINLPESQMYIDKDCTDGKWWCKDKDYKQKKIQEYMDRKK